MRKTKIVCTLGPASKNEAVIEDMLKAGMNVARINFSHGTHAEHKETIATFRSVRDRMLLPAAVMLDTKGPEIRLGTFGEKCVVLQDGQTFTLTADDVAGDSTKVSVTFKKLAEQLEVGNTVLLDDGRIKPSAEYAVLFCLIIGSNVQSLSHHSDFKQRTKNGKIKDR
ncbi:MAG: pyruvate kinase, partial [Clostridia bacterium]|nr:pyruvate kinase [Clostridia bacterium]